MFKVADVICPEQETIFANMTDDVEIGGYVNFFSDGSGSRDEFAILDVPGIRQPIIVPSKKLKLVVREGGEDSNEGVEKPVRTAIG